MPINEWSDNILIVELNDEPSFSDDMDTLIGRMDRTGFPGDIIVDLKAVTHVNSSNIAQLLRLRKKMQDAQGRLRICSVNDHVWSVLLITGLDKVFDFTDDVSTSIASLQISE